MSFLKKIFGSGNEEPKVRVISHPRDLRTGDIIKFRFLDQSDISGKEFEVSQINTYIYGDLAYPEMVLKDRSNNIIYLTVEEEDGEEYLALSKKIDKAKINDVISPDDIEAIKEKGTGTSIKIKDKLPGYEEWFANKYREVDDNIKGSYLKGDARYLSSQEINRQEKFSSYLLEDSDGDYALELEVYKTGETELSVTVYHDIQEIEEMWPAADNN